MQNFHKEVFWIYGVIVGLAIREALVTTLHHLFLMPSVDPWQLHIEAWRTVLFLMMIIRFYFGSLIFFNDTYIDRGRSAEVAIKSYGLDFFMGLMHFIILFAWSVTIVSHGPRRYFGLSNFLIVMAVVLAFDLVWWVFNSGYDTKKRIKLWTAVNLLTLGLSALVFLVVKVSTDNPQIAEEAAMVPVGMIAGVELLGMISERAIFAEWIRKLVD